MYTCMNVVSVRMYLCVYVCIYVCIYVCTTFNSFTTEATLVDGNFTENSNLVFLIMLSQRSYTKHRKKHFLTIGTFTKKKKMKIIPREREKKQRTDEWENGTCEESSKHVRCSHEFPINQISAISPLRQGIRSVHHTGVNALHHPWHHPSLFHSIIIN